ncbi:hypothetical protein [Streptomyces pini]|uniref:hypothetical protein n=1 Tax=Streptomyces pini TaxID=1520580 RepID=UPI0011148260|nr:hypothetical protein [Streptomyces pini]
MAGAVAGVPLGHLADRRGARGTVAAPAVATAAAVAVFLAVRGLPAFVLAAVLCTPAASADWARPGRRCRPPWSPSGSAPASARICSPPRTPDSPPPSP